MNTRNIVSPIYFARHMKTHWETNLHNTSSKPLEKLWQSIAQTFGEAIIGHDTGDRKWRVLEPATGTGKTQGLSVYCALTAKMNDEGDPAHRTGILVVVRTIEQAEEIVATINDLAGRDAAVARHSENKTKNVVCRSRDVLVITHSAYQSASEAIYRGRHGNWPEFTTWEAGSRCLTIIDEALANIVEEYQVTAETLRTTLGYVNARMEDRHPVAVSALRRLLGILEHIERNPQNPKESICWRDPAESGIDWTDDHSMSGLLEELVVLPFDRIALGKDSQLDRQRLANRVEGTLRSCESILSKWAYFHRVGEWDTLNGSELLIPMEIPGPVVLDATASQNMLWELLEHRAIRPSVPRNARSYRNVTLHVAHSSGVGKTAMTKKGPARIEGAISELEKTHGERSVLVCLHKNLKAKALALEPKFGDYAVAHWGAIDGKNDWKDFDTVVILGLPYRGTLWSTNTFFALQGLRSNEWLSSPTWKTYQNVRQTMEINQITVSVVQAINRIRCRKTINGDGDCPMADVFIVLPNDHWGASILDNVTTEMPGINVAAWDFELDGKGARVAKSEGYRALIPYMDGRLPGETAMNKIRTDLGWGAEKMKELRRVLCNPEHFITGALRALGVTFHHNDGVGRGSKSWLLKA